MAVLITHFLSIVLVLFCVLSNGWIVPDDLLDSAHVVPLPLDKRQDELLHYPRPRRSSSDNCSPYISDPDTPDCVALCAPSSFSCSSQPLDRRYITRDPFSEAGNNTVSLPSGPIFVTKRSIQSNPLTQDQLPTYLPNQFNGQYDTYFGLPLATVNDPEDDATVFQLKPFGSSAFAIGAINVHGCTMLTIVSSTAVWMGHIWEVPTWSDTATVFQEGIINWINGASPIFPASGTRFDPTQFTQNVRVYIMHPRRVTAGSYRTPRYPGKISRSATNLQGTIRGVLGQNVPIVQYNYIAYDVRSGVQGIALFQFDPSANGNGKPGWRLFYEQNQFRDTDPTPPASAANGIPEEGINGGDKDSPNRCTQIWRRYQLGCK